MRWKVIIMTTPRCMSIIDGRELLTQL